MIETLINSGHYKFNGTIHDIKKRIRGFKVIEVMSDGCIQGINIYSAKAEFKYHGKKQIIFITSDFSNNKILHLEYKGEREYE